MATEWWTCEQGHEWNDGNGDEECPYCAKEAAKEQQAAADEWARERMKDAKFDDRDRDPREYAYWDKLM